MAFSFLEEILNQHFAITLVNLREIRSKARESLYIQIPLNTKEHSIEIDLMAMAILSSLKMKEQTVSIDIQATGSLEKWKAEGNLLKFNNKSQRLRDCLRIICLIMKTRHLLMHLMI